MYICFVKRERARAHISSELSPRNTIVYVISVNPSEMKRIDSYGTYNMGEEHESKKFTFFKEHSIRQRRLRFLPGQIIVSDQVI